MPEPEPTTGSASATSQILDCHTLANATPAWSRPGRLVCIDLREPHQHREDFMDPFDTDAKRRGRTT